MNVYDFDKTIYEGDSTIEFYMYCLRRHPYIIVAFPQQLIGAVRYKLKYIDKKKFKECFFAFLRYLKNVDCDIERFWIGHRKKIKSWYLEVYQPSDVIISASPYFLLEKICEEMGISNLLASNIDKKTGLFQGENCYGKEKVNRFKEIYAKERIEKFYSDSLSDEPLAKLAEKSYLVKKNQLFPWRDFINEK